MPHREDGVAIQFTLPLLKTKIVFLVFLISCIFWPTVSRGTTLHLGDKISGLLDAPQINQWIRKGLDLGINLIDIVDV